MNFDELAAASTNSLHHESAAITGPHSRQRLYPRHRDNSVSSVPSEPDWVSPFTLPPLPALRRNRDHSSLKSPEHLGQRDASGAYYAAAWGSPYASPSPEPASAVRRPSRRSIDSALSSPPAIRSALNRRNCHSVDISDVSSPEARRKLGARKQLRNRAERPNWLSDSEQSDEEPLQEQDHTPTSRRRLSDCGALSARSSKEDQPNSPQTNDSVDTITPDIFHSPSATRQPTSRIRPMQELVPGDMAEVENAAQKPLPELPLNTSLPDDAPMEETLTSPSRSRMNTMQSFQRPKKKVPWKGKTCVIALPMTDRESAGLPPLLSVKEVRDKVDALISEGWSTHGFDLAERLDEVSSGQSRPTYPDFPEIQSEWKMKKFKVYIPDQREWDDWVQYLQEEKLRALGVSPSNSEAPASVVSPLSQPLSRSSSRYTGLVQSPPIVSPSAASNPLRAASNPFTPTFSASSGFGSQIGSGASSQYNGYAGPIHGHKQSLAMGVGRGASPFEYPAIQPNAFGPGVRSPADGFGRRVNGFSPANVQGIQSLGELLSPAIGPNNQLPAAPRSAQSTHLDRPSVPPQQRSLPRTPTVDQLSRTPIELQHPTPRSHRHNLSAALQKEIDDAEAAWQGQTDRSQDREKKNAGTPSYGDEKIEEEAHDELPILKRPETIGDGDKSDIITNPSVAASPLLAEDKHPSTNWQALSDAARGPPLPSFKSHKAQPSVSKFNVQAKEFDPTAGFKSSNFSFTGGPFEPQAAPFQPQISVVRKTSDQPRQGSSSRLNVEAPSFVPGQAVKTLKEAWPFKFSSATFNVAAAEFNPDKSPSKTFGMLDSTSESDKPAVARIFGNVKIDPDSKVSRRTSKALPLMRPRSKDGPSSRGSSVSLPEAEEVDDEEGRVTAPADRNKRARRTGSDGDNSPIFADSAPFRHTSSIILSEIVDEKDRRSSFEDKSKEKPVDGWAYIPAEEKTSLRKDTPPAPDHVEELPARQSPFEFWEQQEAVKFSEAVPRSLSPSERSEEIDIVEVIEEVSDLPSSPLPIRQSSSGHKIKSSLSALAQPFVLKSAPRTTARPDPAPKARGASGLAASRWADSPSPPNSPPPAPSARLSSPPSHPEPMIKSEEEEDLRDVKITQDVSEEDNDAEAAALSDLSPKGEDTAEESVVIRSPQLSLDSVPVPEDREDDMQPSFEEIDAVMKQFEHNPDLGIERNDSPIGSTPLVDMRLASNFRSDAPSPSPRRNPPREMPSDAASVAAHSLGLGIHRLNTGKEEVSDWGDQMSTTEEEKVQSRAQFFDGHVNDLVDGILENRLGPLERTLQTIQHSIALMATRPQSKGQRSTSSKQKDSDADDEDDYDAYEGFSSYRAKSPEASRNRRTSRIRAAVAEGMAIYRESMQPQVDLSAVLAELAEMKQLVQDSAQQTIPHSQQEEMKAALDEVISNHPRLRGSRVQQDHESSDSKIKLQVDGLEAMLKHEKERADHESLRRRKADEEIELLKRALNNAEARAIEQQESAEQAEQRLVAFVKEKDAYRELEQDFDQLNMKNESLEKTLKEHRKLKEKLQDDIEDERQKNKSLTRTLFDVKDQLKDRTQRCHSLHTKVERLQQQISSAMQDLASEQADWRTRENELRTKMSIIENDLDQATRDAEKTHLDMDDMVKQHKESIMYKDRFENLQQEIDQAQDLIVLLRNESRTNEDKAYQLQRELDGLRHAKDTDSATTIARLTAALEGARAQLDSHKSDFEAQVLRLQSRLDTAEQDFEDQKVRYDSTLAETHDAHASAMRELNERREAALEEQHAAHERKLGDLRDRHTRAMHNSSDDRHRMEHQFNEKLALSEDKVRHLEGKVSDLEDRLEITKSAARAAVEAVTKQGINLPTPASSVVASPPTRAASASLSIVKGEPEKIPVQSLRESIIVLQDQLQAREQRIEKLEAELSHLDKDAPAKIKESETEVQWLRELLAVRVDDIEDIITTLASPSFDREAVKDAAIRLKANIQMEQQIRERSTQGQSVTAVLPSLSTVAAYAQSPRQALPLVATAAWGNFRKAREAGGDFYERYVSQTPSKSTMGSPASFLSGIMTPPNTQTSLSRANSDEELPPPSMRPLAAAAAAAARKAQGGGEAGPRPLRGYNSQPRALGKKINADTMALNTSIQRSPSPHTPVMNRGKDADFSEDVDEDASPLGRVDGRGEGVGASV